MLRTLLMLACVTLIGGLTPVMAKVALQEIPPLTLASYRFAIAGVLLFIVVKLRRGLPRFARGDWWRLVLLASVMVPVNQIGFLIGLRYTRATHAGLLFALSPILMFWGSLLLRQAGFRVRMLAASALAFAGAGVVIALTGRGGSAPMPHMVRGDALVLLAVLSWTAFALLSQPLVRRYGPLRTLMTVTLVGALMMLPLTVLDAGRMHFEELTWRGVGGLLYMAVMASFAGMLLWGLAIVKIDAPRVAVVTNLTPVVTVVFGHLLLDEPLSRWILVGAALILGGIYLAIGPATGRPRGETTGTADAPASGAETAQP